MSMKMCQLFCELIIYQEIRTFSLKEVFLTNLDIIVVLTQKITHDNEGIPVRCWPDPPLHHTH